MAELMQIDNRPAASPRWVTLGRACEILGVDESTLRRWADTGRVRVYRTPGGHRRFDVGNLEEMLAGQQTPPPDEIERRAVPKIRRQLQQARRDEYGWYASLSEGDRKKLGGLGRHLIEMAGEYLEKRTRRPGLLEQAREVGGAYGRILAEAGLPLPSAVGAYIGFRRTMDETTRQAALHKASSLAEGLEACGQVHALGDQVLLGLAAAYEAALPVANEPLLS